MKLYEITDGYMKYLDKQEELTQEEAQEIQSQLQVALKEKSTNIVGYYLDRKAMVEAIDTEIKRLSDMKKALNNQVDSYKDYVKSNMEAMGIDKIETPIGKISISKSPVSVEILDESEVPEDYKEYVEVCKVDKKKIADNFKATGEIPAGTKINYNNTHLLIK